MPHPPVAQPFVHVVARSALMSPLLLRTSDYRALLTVVSSGLARYPTRLLGYALLPTHWELILGPIDSRRARHLARWVATTHAARLRSLRRLPPDQPAYREPARLSELRSARDLVRLCRAVERRAVDALLVTRAEDWPWSSLTDRFRLLQHLPLATTPFLASEWWVAHVNHPRPLAADHASGDFAENPGRLAGLLQRGQQVPGIPGRGNDRQSDPHVERAKHLRLRHLAGRL